MAHLLRGLADRLASLQPDPQGRSFFEVKAHVVVALSIGEEPVPGCRGLMGTPVL